MNVALTEKVLNLHIPLNVWEKDMLDILDPLYKKDKIYERDVVNVEVDRKENNDIIH